MAQAPKKNGKNEIPAPIIVKKVTIVAGGHHGGAWKVAYADFVTAMMAFFLLMWLLGATTEKQRKGIADFFTPTLVKTRQGSAGSNGLLGGSSMTDVDHYAHRAGQTGTKTMTIPRDTVGGPKEGGTKIKRIAQMAAKLKARLSASAQLKKLAGSVKLTATPDGIRIDLLDDAKFSMFQLGTTILTPDPWRCSMSSARRSARNPTTWPFAGTPMACNTVRGMASAWASTTGRSRPGGRRPRARP